MKMRELEQRTGIGREAIRFYIREGMLPEPDKPKKNVANYSEEHVTRINVIRELQDKRFLPLARIKQLLASAEVQSLGDVGGVEYLLPAMIDGATPGPDRTIDDLAARTGLDPDELADMARAGIISISSVGTVDFRDAAIAEVWGRTRAAGFSREAGFGSDHAIRYVRAAEALASAEVELFLNAFARDPAQDAAQLGAKGVALANELFCLVHTRAIVERLIEAQDSSTIAGATPKLAS